jgi:hypothetical protein
MSQEYAHLNNSLEASKPPNRNTVNWYWTYMIFHAYEIIKYLS